MAIKSPVVSLKTATKQVLRFENTLKLLLSLSMRRAAGRSPALLEQFGSSASRYFDLTKHTSLAWSDDCSGGEQASGQLIEMTGRRGGSAHKSKWPGGVNRMG